MSWLRYWALYAPQQQSRAASGALSEAPDGCTAAASLAVHLAGSPAEGADACSGVVRAGVGASGALQEADDRFAGDASLVATAVIDPNFLISARPRVRSIATPPRLRAIRARPRARTIIAAKRA